MSEIKALFPIGKTQWSKWGDDARKTFNEVRGDGHSHEDAVRWANDAELIHREKRYGILGTIHDVVDTVEEFSGVVAAVAPVVAVVKHTRSKKGK